jgi:hypothetical protein
VRAYAIDALKKIGNAQAVESLIQALKDKNAREAAANALEEIGEPAVESLVQALKDKNGDVRRCAVDILVKIRVPAGVLIAAQKNTDEYVREKATVALKKMKTPAIERLLRDLKDKDYIVRYTAAQALGKIGDARAVEALCCALKDEEDSLVRWYEVIALGDMRDAAAVKALNRALKDEDYQVGEAAAEALKKIKDAHAATELTQAQPLHDLGIVFNIAGLGSGSYGVKAWHIFMENVNPDSIAPCILKHGDTLTKGVKTNQYCIAICGATRDLNQLKLGFTQLEHKGLAPKNSRFIRKLALDSEPLVIKGSVDAEGRFVTEEWDRGDHDLCKEMRWRYTPRKVPADLPIALRTELNEMKKGPFASN